MLGLPVPMARQWEEMRQVNAHTRARDVSPQISRFSDLTPDLLNCLAMTF